MEVTPPRLGLLQEGHRLCRAEPVPGLGVILQTIHHRERIEARVHPLALELVVDRPTAHQVIVHRPGGQGLRQVIAPQGGQLHRCLVNTYHRDPSEEASPRIPLILQCSWGFCIVERFIAREGLEVVEVVVRGCHGALVELTLDLSRQITRLVSILRLQGAGSIAAILIHPARLVVPASVLFPLLVRVGILPFPVGHFEHPPILRVVTSAVTSPVLGHQVSTRTVCCQLLTRPVTRVQERSGRETYRPVAANYSKTTNKSAICGTMRHVALLCCVTSPCDKSNPHVFL